MAEKSRRGTASKSTNILKLEQRVNQAADLETKADLIFDFYAAYRGSYRDYLSDLADQLASQAEEIDNHYVLGMAALLAGWLNLDSDKREEAIALFKQAQKSFKKAGDKRRELRALNGEASALKQLGRVEETLNKYLDGIEQARALNDADLISSFGTNLGSFMAGFGLFDEALGYFNELLALAGREQSNFAADYYLMGNTYLQKGDYEQAECYLLKGIKECSKEGREYLRALCQLDIAGIQLGRGLLEKSSELAREVLKVGEQLKIPSLQASALFELAKTEIARKDYAEALKHALAALQIRRDTGAKRPAARILFSLAEIYEALEDYPKAYQALKEAREIEKEQLDDNLVNSLKIAKVKQVRRENTIYKRLYERISTIGQIGREITATFAVEEVGRLIYANLKALLPVTTLAIGIYNKDFTELECKIYIRADQSLPEFAVPVSQKPVLSLKEPALAAEVLEHPQYPTPEKEKSVLQAPLVMRNEVIGAVVVQTEEEGAYQSYHQDILEALAGYIAIALENGSLFSHVKELASVDSLTGLYNRRVLFEMAGRAFAEAKRHKTPLSVVMIDTDGLKKVNDTYGHAAGDRLLKQTAQIFTAAIRASDLLGRIGGDEFLLILPETEPKEALMLAERLRENLSETPLRVENAVVGLKASFGVAHVSPADLSIEQTVSRADRGLYDSKRKGGNTVSFVK